MLIRKRQKRVYHVILTTAVTAVFLFITSCASAPAPEKPAWMTNFPTDNAYYIGVAGSNIGVQTEDNEIAKKRALATLASEISAEIISEINIRTFEDNKGNAENAVEEAITQHVAQNLKAVETVDAFYSPEDGYWYYLRLNKAEWAAIQKREMAEIERRVKNLVEPVLGNSSRTIAEILPLLVDGWTIVNESPYPGMIETSLMGENGMLIDLLERQIALNIGALSIDLINEEVAAEMGRPVYLVFDVRSSKENKPGQLQIDLVDRNTDSSYMRCTTSSNGEYEDNIDLSGLTPGKNYVTAVLNTDILGFEGKPIQLNPPKADFMIDVQQIKTSLNMDYTGDIEEMENASGIYGTVKALLSDTLPVKIESTGGHTFEIDFKLNYRNAPPNDYGFTIIYIKANISLLRNGANIYTYETEEFKGAGLDWIQANTKGLEKLLANFETNSEFAIEANRAFSMD